MCCHLQVTVYWLSHYPSSVADVAVGDWRSPEVVAQDGKAKASTIVHKLKGNKGKRTCATVLEPCLSSKLIGVKPRAHCCIRLAV